MMSPSVFGRGMQNHGGNSNSANNCPSYGINGDSDDSEDEGFQNMEMDSRPVDPFRFSQATLEDTQEDELNAILGELSALQMSLDRDLRSEIKITSSSESSFEQRNIRPISTTTETGVRSESIDNDSGFSDSASLLSSGSSMSASGSSSGSSTTSNRMKTIRNTSSPNEDEKAEKIREALAKIRAANVTRLYVKAFSVDGSSKALMVDESMSTGKVLALLADKNHVPLSTKWALVEHIPHLHMERIYEDHENMVENLLMWTRDSKNKIYFVEKEEKYDMFNSPGRYFSHSRVSPTLDEKSKLSLISEFFNHGVGVPDVETSLYLKGEGKKTWKKFHFVLRASGVYYYPKGKSHSNSSKDLICLTTLDTNIEAYEGVGWRKKLKSPTEYGFALKPARLQAKSHRHMKYLCAEDIVTLQLWMTGIRIAKHGKTLWENYRSLEEDIAHEDLDRFGRSVSLASMPIQISTSESNNTYTQTSKIQEQNHDIRQSTVPMVLNGPSLQSIVIREEGFESENPLGGTIKRKPSTVLSPKIPLTLSTRNLVSDYITPGDGNTLTLGRKRSLTSSSSSTQSKNPIGTTPPVHEEELLADFPPPPPELLTDFSDNEDNRTSTQGTPPSILKLPPPSPYSRQKSTENNSEIQRKKSVTFNEIQHPNNLRLNSSAPSSTMITIHPPISSPKKLEEPPPEFLFDLQRVMNKKWQVAQKCQIEKLTHPGEILGFRSSFILSSPDSEPEQPLNPGTLNNVRAWVCQHYGTTGSNTPEEIQQPPCNTGSPRKHSPAPPPKPRILESQPTQVIYENFSEKQQQHHQHLNKFHPASESYQIQLRNKPPPPPIPRRADSTHLSVHFVYN